MQKNYIVDGDVPIQTNKFYANFFLGSQRFPVWTHPYSLAWAKGAGDSYGMAITHTVREQFAFGPNPNRPQYFISPIGIHHLVLSAAELDESTHLSVENLKAFSVYANLAASANTRVLMSLPCVQGMGLITALYDRAQPMIRSGVFFRTLDHVALINGVTHKYRITLNDGSRWLLYATSIGSVGTPPFVLTNSSTITGPKNFVGMIQVTKNPAGVLGEQAFDSSAGSYAINATITGSVDGSSGSYSLSWAKGGVQSQTLLMYALPHHVESFDQRSRAALQDITLVTTTKGYARAVLADQITMLEEDLPDTIAFAPWAKSPNGAAGGSGNINLSPGASSLIGQAGISELSQDFDSQTRLNSMYYSGKGLAKFAAIIYTLDSMTKENQYAAAGLARLKDAFNVFVNNTQPEPLIYDQVWKGVVSSATYRPPYDTGLDFGNTLYNDHHFHYGYFVWTAAVIGHLDPSWLEQSSNKAWVNTLVRDYANPVTDDFYPFQRSFDWFHGHSWAKGLFESGDGKDQESTSEDTFATYALKMWGKIIRDPNMEARGNLQLAVQARSLRNYFLLESDNQNQPPQFLPNKVTGILFENKIDHTTYFGSNTEYIEGIHMIPLNPSSAYTRQQKFVTEEWNTYFSGGRVDQVTGGWKGILYANLALVDPQRSYNFFADPGFNTQLDGGASRTWYLAYSAAMLAASNGNVGPDESLTYNATETEDTGPKYMTPEYTDAAYATPEYEPQAYTEPAYTEPTYTEPAYTEPVNVVPVYTAPAYTQPAYTQPAESEYTDPEYTSPQYAPPKDVQPEYTEPLTTAPLYTEPNVAPVYTQPPYSPPPSPPSPSPWSTSHRWPVGFDWPQATPRPRPTYTPAEPIGEQGVRPAVYEWPTDDANQPPVQPQRPVEQLQPQQQPPLEQTQGESEGDGDDEGERLNMNWALQDEQQQDDDQYSAPDYSDWQAATQYQDPDPDQEQDDDSDGVWNYELECDDELEDDVDYVDAGEDAGRFLEEQW